MCSRRQAWSSTCALVAALLYHCVTAITRVSTYIRVITNRTRFDDGAELSLLKRLRQLDATCMTRCSCAFGFLAFRSHGRTVRGSVRVSCSKLEAQITAHAHDAWAHSRFYNKRLHSAVCEYGLAAPLCAHTPHRAHGTSLGKRPSLPPARSPHADAADRTSASRSRLSAHVHLDCHLVYMLLLLDSSKHQRSLASDPFTSRMTNLRPQRHVEAHRTCNENE